MKKAILILALAAGFMACKKNEVPQKKATHLQVTSISVKAYGTWFDVGSAPDLYFAIFKNGINIFQTDYVNNQYTATFPVDLLLEKDAEYQIDIYDFDDLDADDFVGSIILTPSNSDFGTQNPWVFGNTDAEVKLYGTWK